MNDSMPDFHQTLSPQAKGLFHKAIFQSGVATLGNYTSYNSLEQAKVHHKYSTNPSLCIYCQIKWQYCCHVILLFNHNRFHTMIICFPDKCNLSNSYFYSYFLTFIYSHMQIVANLTGCEYTTTEQLVSCFRGKSEQDLIDATKKVFKVNNNALHSLPTPWRCSLPTSAAACKPLSSLYR